MKQQNNDYTIYSSPTKSNIKTTIISLIFPHNGVKNDGLFNYLLIIQQTIEELYI